MARPRGGFPRTRRRQTHWAEMAGATTLSATTATLLAVSQAGHEGETVARLRGLCAVTLETGASVDDGFFGAIGFAIVTSAAAAAGVASIPTPITEAGWDGWFLHRYFDVRTGTSAADGSGFARLELDSKAMRKVNEDEAIVMVSEVIEDGTAVAVLTCRARILSMIG